MLWQDALGKTVAQTPAQRSSVIPADCRELLYRMEGLKPVRFTVL